MGANTVRLSERHHALAEQQAAAGEFASIDDYLASLVEEQAQIDALLRRPDLVELIREGEASGAPRRLDRAELDRIWAEGRRRAAQARPA